MTCRRHHRRICLDSQCRAERNANSASKARTESTADAGGFVDFPDYSASVTSSDCSPPSYDSGSYGSSSYDSGSSASGSGSSSSSDSGSSSTSCD